MTFKIIRTPRAQRDLIEHYAFIARDKVDPADRFLRVVEETIEFLAEMPQMGRAWESSDPRLSGVRVYPLPRRFRSYLLFYRPIAGGIEVLTVLHGTRDLGLALRRVADERNPEKER